MLLRGLSYLVFAAALLAMVAPSVAQYSKAVKGACRDDYKRFCSTHAVDDPALRKCMDRAGPSLSKRCVATLVNQGEVSYQRATQRWGHKLERVQ